MPLLIFSTWEMAVIGITVGVIVFFAVYGVWGWFFDQRPPTTVLQVGSTEFTHMGEVRWYRALQDGQPITVKLFGKLIPEIEIYLWREREMRKLFFSGILVCFTFTAGLLVYLYQLDSVKFFEGLKEIRLLANVFNYPGWIEGLLGSLVPAALLEILVVSSPLWITLAALLLLAVYYYFGILRPWRRYAKGLETNNELLQGKLDDTDLTISKLQNSLAKLEKQITELRNEKYASEIQSGRLESEKSELELANEALDDRIVILQGQLEDLQADIARLQAECDQHAAQLLEQAASESKTAGYTGNQVIAFRHVFKQTEEDIEAAGENRDKATKARKQFVQWLQTEPLTLTIVAAIVSSEEHQAEFLPLGFENRTTKSFRDGQREHQGPLAFLFQPKSSESESGGSDD